MNNILLLVLLEELLEFQRLLTDQNQLNNEKNTLENSMQTTADLRTGNFFNS